MLAQFVAVGACRASTGKCQRHAKRERGGVGHCCLRGLGCNGHDLRPEGGKAVNRVTRAREVNKAGTKRGLIARSR